MTTFQTIAFAACKSFLVMISVHKRVPMASVMLAPLEYFEVADDESSNAVRRVYIECDLNGLLLILLF